MLAKTGESSHDQASGWEGRVREEGWGHVNNLQVELNDVVIPCFILKRQFKWLQWT